MNDFMLENYMGDSFMAEKEKSAIIEIPDPNFIQFPNQGPSFLDLLPSGELLEHLEIHVNWMIVVYLNRYQNKNVKDYLEAVEKIGLKQGLKIKRDQDFIKKEFIYTFEKLLSPP